MSPLRDRHQLTEAKLDIDLFDPAEFDETNQQFAVGVGSIMNCYLAF